VVCTQADICSRVVVVPFSVAPQSDFFDQLVIAIERGLSGRKPMAKGLAQGADALGAARRGSNAGALRLDACTRVRMCAGEQTPLRCAGSMGLSDSTSCTRATLLR
jgi:hypothetical protein